jgi:hypothetical protein
LLLRCRHESAPLGLGGAIKQKSGNISASAVFSHSVSRNQVMTTIQINLPDELAQEMQQRVVMQMLDGVLSQAGSR